MLMMEHSVELLHFIVSSSLSLTKAIKGSSVCRSKMPLSLLQSVADMLSVNLL